MSNRSSQRPIGDSSPSILLAEIRKTVTDRLWKVLSLCGYEVELCSSIPELSRAYTDRIPDLLLIGTLEDGTCLDVLRSLDGFNSAVIVLVDDTKINDFFKDWVTKKGVRDVLSNSEENLHQLLKTIGSVLGKTTDRNLLKPQGDKTSSLGITYGFAQNILNQISRCSLKYFGALAIGNYWRKSQARLNENDWLKQWQISFQGEISLPEMQKSSNTLTAEEVLVLQAWVGSFILECDRVIGNYYELLMDTIDSANTKEFISNSLKSSNYGV